MSVGTKQIKLVWVKNNELKLSNIKSTQIQERETNIFLSILKAIGIGLIAAGLGFLGQAWATPGLLALGWSEVTATTAGYFVGASIEFSTLMGYDALTDQVTPVNTILNLLVFSKVLKGFSTSKKMAKALVQADDFGIFRELKIDPKSIKTYRDLLKALNGKKVTINQILYDFTEGVSKSDVLHIFANWTTAEGISKISKMGKTAEGIIVENLEDLVQFQNLLLEINPGLFPKVDRGYFKQTMDFLKEQKIKPKDLLNDEIFAGLVLTIRTTAGYVSGNMVWALYSLRLTKQIDMQITNSFLKILRNTNKVLANLDVSKLVTKIINKTFNKLLSPLKKTIEKLKTKIFKTVSKKLDPFLKKWNLAVIKKFGKITYENVDKLLIPIDSAWLFAYRVKPLINATYMVQVYFKKIKYEPRTFYWNAKELADWVKACESGEAGEFYKANLELGYHLKSSGFLAALNFLPAVVGQFIKEGIKIYQQIKKLKKEFENINELKQKIGNEANKTMNKNLTNYIFAIGFSSVFFRTIFKNWATKKSNKKYIESAIVSKGKQGVIPKIRKI